jgi:hypothetical protein
LPDDDQWDSQQLSAILGLLSDPPVKANYLAAVKRAKQLPTETASDFAMTNIVSQTEFVTAQQSLNALDSDEAIRQRVKMIQMESKEALAMARDYRTGSVLPQRFLESSTRADFFVQRMMERAEEPDFGVDYNCDYWWTRFLVQQHDAEVLRPFHDETQRRKNSQDYSSYLREAQLEILANLESAVQSKKGEAHKITALTIGTLQSFTSHTP